jgi:signal transduction histidine kinase
LDRGRHDLKDIVDEAVEFCRFSASRKSINLLSDGVQENATVNVDRQRIVQVLTNLIDNAIKFTSEGGTVKVSYEVSADRAVLSVSDTGSGISEEDQGRIFEAYWQGKRSSRGGSGLGLAIVKRIVEEHEGFITVKSRLGTGTTFSIILPHRLQDLGLRPPQSAA